MGPNDGAERQVEIPLPVISVYVEAARLAGGSSAAVSPSIEVSPVLRPGEGAIFASVDNGLD
jgi:hypothetical protein